jgi:hypothetical protein
MLSDGALLSSAGLDVPQPVTLLCALRKAGWDVRTDRLLPEEAVEEIVRVGQAASSTCVTEEQYARSN